MEIIGKIKVIGQTTFVNTSFKRRELVVVTSEQYPQTIAISFVQDKCGILDNYHQGQEVRVSINLRGREWTNTQGEVKYFNDIQGWRIEAVGEQSSTEQQQAQVPQEEENPLPF